MSNNPHFTDHLIERISQTGSSVVVGLDTDPRRLPPFLMQGDQPADRSQSAMADAQFEFNKAIVDAVHSIVPAVKVQIAFYELLGPAGLKTYQKTIQYARDRGLLVIGDIKRGDIGSTANAYAEAHLAGESAADAVTVNPYMGSDAIMPFIEIGRRQGKGVFVLVKTSNPSSSELQDLEVADLRQRNYEIMARNVGELGADTIGKHGYSLVGAVVGATYPTEGQMLRGALPHTLFLVPGYGAQGAKADDVAGCFAADGSGAIVNASRSIIFAYEALKSTVGNLVSVGESARDAALAMSDDINRAIGRK